MVTSLSITYITLNNNHNDIDYNRVREDVDTGVIRMAHINKKYNLSDILTNPLGPHYIWQLLSNYPVFIMVMIIYHYVERIWRIIVTSIFLYNIYYHE